MPSSTALLLALAASASAHVRMTNPVPYAQATLSQSPLEPADFPCQQGNGFAVTKMNAWPAGTKQTVKFQGTAVHGGGSCQFSITADSKPNQQSQFKVIQQVIGGCPMNTPGNAPVPPSATYPIPGGFDVMMPKDIPDGTYTFAWSWFNKVGNREFYMNCAPIKVTGGSGNDMSSLAKLPNMFVANLPNVMDSPATACTTTEGQDISFTAADATGPGCAAQMKLGAGAGKLPAPIDSSTTDNPPATNPPATNPPATNPAKPSPSPTRPLKSNPAKQAPQAQDLPVNSAPPATAGTVCPEAGKLVCIGSNQFGICNNGVAVPMMLAAGTACKKGTIVASAPSRRGVHLHSRRHI